MRKLLAILLYALAKAVYPQLTPRTPGNVSEYDPYVRRVIEALQRGDRARIIEPARCEDDTEPYRAFDTGWVETVNPINREGRDSRWNGDGE